MEEAVYRVVPHEGDWRVEYDGRSLSQNGTRAMAILQAAEHARAKMPARVVVLDSEGRVVEDTPYRDDFDPPPVASASPADD